MIQVSQKTQVDLQILEEMLDQLAIGGPDMVISF